MEQNMLPNETPIKCSAEESHLDESFSSKLHFNLDYRYRNLSTSIRSEAALHHTCISGGRLNKPHENNQEQRLVFIIKRDDVPQCTVECQQLHKDLLKEKVSPKNPRVQESS